MCDAQTVDPGDLVVFEIHYADRIGAAPCTFSFHSACVDPELEPGAPDRWSIEVRCLVIYC